MESEAFKSVSAIIAGPIALFGGVTKSVNEHICDASALKRTAVGGCRASSCCVGSPRLSALLDAIQ